MKYGRCQLGPVGRKAPDEAEAQETCGGQCLKEKGVGLREEQAGGEKEAGGSAGQSISLLCGQKGGRARAGHQRSQA